MDKCRRCEKGWEIGKLYYRRRWEEGGETGGGNGIMNLEQDANKDKKVYRGENKISEKKTRSRWKYGKDAEKVGNGKEHAWREVEVSRIKIKFC